MQPEYIEHVVRPDGLPPVIGYSHAVLFSGPMMVISGQVPVDADGNLVGKDDPAAQVRQVFANLAGVLAAAGATMAQVVKFTYFVTDMSLLSAVRQVRDEFIDASRPPASSFVQVAGLVNPDFMIEIEALVATVTRRGGGRFRRRPTGRSGRASAR